MGPAQWQRVEQAFENDFADCDMVLFGTPTPLVFLSQKCVVGVLIAGVGGGGGGGGRWCCFSCCVRGCTALPSFFRVQ